MDVRQVGDDPEYGQSAELLDQAASLLEEADVAAELIDDHPRQQCSVLGLLQHHRAVD